MRVRISSTKSDIVIVHAVSDGMVEVPVRGKMKGLIGNIQMMMASCSIEKQADILQWSFASAPDSRELLVSRSATNRTDSERAAVQVMLDLSAANIKGILSVSLHADETIQVYKRTGEIRGEVIHSHTTLEDIVIQVNATQYQQTPNTYEYIVVARDSGVPLRLKRVIIDIKIENKTSAGESKREAEPKQGPKFFPLFTNNMILQRDANVAVYGTAELSASLEVTFANQTVTTIADSSFGFWVAYLNPMPASRIPEILSVTDGSSTVSVKNVLVGDIWLAGGQSNMDRPFKLFKSLNSSGIFNPRIRLLDILDNYQKQPADSLRVDPDIDTSWQVCQSDVLENFSPAAYFFAEKVERELKVPVGIILSASGATKIERWIPANVFTELGYPPDAVGNQVNYNGMIYPLRNFTFKGIIWYQGESNADQPEDYVGLFRGLINSWRSLFGNPYLPFYFAQLASFGPRSSDKTDTKWAFLREAQDNALDLPGTRMIVLTDAGEYSELHPEDKLAVGERFARHALVAGGLTDTNVDNPSFLTMEIKGNSVLLTFDHVGDGLETREVRMNKARGLAPGTDPHAFVVPKEELRGFTVAGPDQVFVEANASITSFNQVTIWSEYVSTPVAVRYCFTWFGLCNLYASNDGLVAKPFRTDYFSLPSFNGDTMGELFDGDFEALGVPMNISLSAGPSNITSVTMKGIVAYQAGAGQVSSLNEIYYSASTDSEFLSGPYVIVTIVYFDKGTNDDIRMRYCGQKKSPATLTAPIQVLLQNTLTWRVATVVLRDAVFDKGFLKNDLRLQSNSKNLVINGVYLRGTSSSTLPTTSGPTAIPSGEERYPTTAPTSAGTLTQQSSPGTDVPTMLASPTSSPSIDSGKMSHHKTITPTYTTTVLPTTVASTGGAPTPGTSTGMPDSEIPTTGTPSYFASTQIPTTTAPVIESGKVDSTTTMIPTVATTVATTSEAPIHITSIPAAFSIGTHASDTPTSEIPTSENPTSAIPTSTIPTTEAPTSSVPFTFIPTTRMPSSAMPTSNSPNTYIPTTIPPTIDTPTTEMPLTSTQLPTASTDYHYQSDQPSVIPTVGIAVNTLPPSTLSPGTTTSFPAYSSHHPLSTVPSLVPTSWDTLDAGYVSDFPSTNPPAAWQAFSSTPTTASPNGQPILSVYWIDPSLTRMKAEDELASGGETKGESD